MELHHEKITIRQATKADASLLANWWNDGTIMSHAGFPLGLGTTADKVAAELGPGCLLLLFDDHPIGEMCYRNAGTSTAEIGIKICESRYQEKGIGKTALSMLIQELFRMGYCRIILDANLKNTRAQHVYETLGFQKLRTNYDSWKNQLGEWESSVDYELTIASFRNYISQK